MGVSVALGYIKPIAVTCTALRLCLTLARSVTICHQLRHSHTPPPPAPELLGNEKGGVCWGSVCVCARAPAGSCRGRPAFTPGRGGLYVKEVCF